MGLRALTVLLALAGCWATASAQGAGWSSYSTAGVTQEGSLKAEVALKLQREQLAEYGKSFEQLAVSITPETPTRLHVKIAPPGVARWEVPPSIVPRPGPEPGLEDSRISYQVLQPAAQPGEPFALTITRRLTGQTLFDTTGHRFLFKEQYIELTTALPVDADLLGIGEVSLPGGMLLPRDGTTIALWARDMPSANPYANLYGSHPFYLQVNKDGSSHGVLFLNSNGMDVTLNPTSLTYKVIGGVVELYFFTGPSPEEVVRQYHALIGRPAMPPFWALGLHQSRWGYKDLASLQQVVANYSAAGLPLETVWSDIEYMPKFWTMAFDPKRYPAPAMRAFVDGLHAAGQHWIPITDAGVAAAEGYGAYEAGLAAGVFVRDHGGKQPYLGQVWPGKAVFPDFHFNPKTVEWLTVQLKKWHDQVPWDGLWLDMNEPASFCGGATCAPNTANQTAMHWLTVEAPADHNLTELIPRRTACQMTCTAAAAPEAAALDAPPYAIHNWRSPSEAGAPIGWNTMAPSARRANGAREYDTHNLFGTAMAIDHHAAVAAITGKRPFMLSPSTFPGAGRYTAHWTGDNGANWANLYYSIAGIINSGLWGISMAGADICGFFDVADGESTDSSRRSSDAEYQQLCNRWASAGAFYPFSRNHYTYAARPHEYYRWPDVAASAQKAYWLRYRLLTYIYTSLYLAHTQGGAVARPLFFTHPGDLNARNASQQWMLGEALLVSPVVTKDTTSIKPYFTAGTWYSAWNYSRLESRGEALPLEVPLGDVAVHIRGGAVLPMQPYANVTRDVRFAPLTLLVGASCSGRLDAAAAAVGVRAGDGGGVEGVAWSRRGPPSSGQVQARRPRRLRAPRGAAPAQVRGRGLPCASSAARRGCGARAFCRPRVASARLGWHAAAASRGEGGACFDVPHRARPRQASFVRGQK